MTARCLCRAAEHSTGRSRASSWRRCGIYIDGMTEEQKRYVSSWQEGHLTADG